MCHGHALEAFPEPQHGTPFSRHLNGFAFGSANAKRRAAILPDIYGCNPFYKGMATRYAEAGAQVFLMDPFHGLGDLPEVTREAAFKRRHQVKDNDFVSRFHDFVSLERIDTVIGFCLGGLYVFDLARRGCDATLVGLYGFPQGLPNQDPLPTPFEYLPSVTTRFSMLLGADDISVGPEHISQLQAMRDDVPAMDLHVYAGVGHNFLPGLDGPDGPAKDVARDALKRCDEAILPGTKFA